MNSPKWTGRTRGGYLGNRIFMILLKVGLAPAYGLLAPVSLYYMTFRRRLCESARDYLERIYNKKVSPFSPRLYALLYSFGMSIIDRTAFFSGSGKVSIDTSESDAKISEALARGRGAAILTAHVGGWQLSSNSLLGFGVPARVVGTDNEVREISEMFEKSEKLKRPEEIPPDAFGAAAAYAALKAGGIVAIHADRYVSGRFGRRDFLGSPARFPLMPFALAQKAGSPAIQILCVRTAAAKYKTLAREIPLSPDIGKMLDKYVANLEAALRRHPLQWFNFYDFWSQ